MNYYEAQALCKKLEKSEGKDGWTYVVVGQTKSTHQITLGLYSLRREYRIAVYDDENVFMGYLER